MCGIVGLFAKTRSVEDSLGKLLSDMLVIMSDRGPDSDMLVACLLPLLAARLQEVRTRTVYK